MEKVEKFFVEQGKNIFEIVAYIVIFVSVMTIIPAILLNGTDKDLSVHPALNLYETHQSGAFNPLDPRSFSEINTQTVYPTPTSLVIATTGTSPVFIILTIIISYLFARRKMGLYKFDMAITLFIPYFAIIVFNMIYYWMSFTELLFTLLIITIPLLVGRGISYIIEKKCTG